MDTDTDSDSHYKKGIPQKKRKVVRYNQKYCNSWEEEKAFKGWLNKSSKGDTYFYCNACMNDLKCSGGGKKDVEKHAISEKHIKHAKG